MSYKYLDSNGVIVPDTSTLLTTVQDEYSTAFGTTIVPTSNTPQGALITAEVASRATFLQNNAALANQINPNLAGGIFLDAIGRLTGYERDGATSSTVTIACTGVAGTVIPVGQIVADSSGNQFKSLAIITLDGTGNASGTFACTITGPIAAPADTLTTIVNGVIGWETANNPSDAVLGTLQESDEQFRAARNAAVGALGASTADAIIASVSLVSGEVGKPSFLENYMSSTQVIDGVTMVANSIYLCVAGGTDLDVATAIYRRKPMGVNYNNGASSNPVSQAVVDPVSGQTQTVLFDRPDLIQILVQVEVLASSAVVDPTDIVQAAILDYVSGGVDGEPGFGVGDTVYTPELIGAINKAAPSLVITSLLISVVTPLDFQSTPIVMEKWQQATTDASSITVNLV